MNHKLKIGAACLELQKRGPSGICKDPQRPTYRDAQALSLQVWFFLFKELKVPDEFENVCLLALHAQATKLDLQGSV